MTNEEFQRLVLEKLLSLEQGQVGLDKKVDAVELKLTEKIDAVETKLTEKIDAVETKLNAKIDAVETRLTEKIEYYGQIQQDDVKGILELMNNKLDRVVANQATQGESINILALRQLQLEAKVAALEKAKIV